jgi:signal transduction histidine kinase
MGKKTRSQRQREAWQTIADQAQRISDILAELMEFARPPQPEATEIDAAELLTAAAEAFASSDHPQAGTSQVDIEIDENVPAIRADREQIQMVIEELIANAAAAGPAVHVRLRAAGDEANDAVLLTVTDDGAGMDAATVARACTPFFSAQAAGRRHGLGLPRARRYVENNRGRMWIDSTPGEGTTVSIRLPGAWEVPGEREQS